MFLQYHYWKVVLFRNNCAEYYQYFNANYIVLAMGEH